MDVLRLNALVYALRRAKHLVYRPPDGPTCSGASSRNRIASVQLDNGFRRTLDQIRGIAESRTSQRASTRDPFTAWIVVGTGDGPNGQLHRSRQN